MTAIEHDRSATCAPRVCFCSRSAPGLRLAGFFVGFHQGFAWAPAFLVALRERFALPVARSCFGSLAREARRRGFRNPRGLGSTWRALLIAVCRRVGTGAPVDMLALFAIAAAAIRLRANHLLRNASHILCGYLRDQSFNARLLAARQRPCIGRRLCDVCVLPELFAIGFTLSRLNFADLLSLSSWRRGES